MEEAKPAPTAESPTPAQPASQPEPAEPAHPEASAPGPRKPLWPDTYKN